MRRNLLLIFIIFVFFIGSSFAYNYNSTYSDLEIEQNGWCINMDTSFKIYNKSEYDLHKDDDEDYNFTIIVSPKIKLYSGPFDSLPVILDTTASSSGEFSYKFTTSNDYLLEIYPQSGNFNDYHSLIAIDDCKYSNPLTVALNSTQVKTVKLYNSSFIYTDVKISLQDTTIQTKENLTVKSIENVAQNGLTALDGVVKAFNLQGVNNNYSSMDVEVSLISIEAGKLIKGYYYSNNVWVSNPIDVVENKVTFKNAKYGIYAITFEEAPVLSIPEPVTTTPDLTPVVEETDSPSDVLGTEEENTDLNIDSSNNPELEYNFDESSSSKSIYMYILFGLFVIGLGFGLYKLSKNKTVDKKPMPEVLNSYNEIYAHAKNYIQTYKGQYGKDQIYRALETANVPRDIIDKIFLEEY